MGNRELSRLSHSTIGSKTVGFKNHCATGSSPENKYYHGFNLWKWKENWPPNAKSYSNWLLLASWAFPVQLNEKIKIAVEMEGPDIKVFFNDQLKGTVYDSDPLKEGYAGIASCEGMNNFYNFKVIKK